MTRTNDPVLSTVVRGLMTRWFPTMEPIDESQWRDIAYADAQAALDALAEGGYLISKKVPEQRYPE